LAESVLNGVTTVYEIATEGWERAPFERSSARSCVMLESIGLGAARVAERIEASRRHLDEAGDEHRWRGLSPHAPYTTTPGLVKTLAGMASARRAPLAMHLAESPEEIELLATGGGPIRAMLERLGAWNEAVFPGGRRVLELLTLLAEADEGLVIHGNFLDDEERAFCAKRADRLSVVYCPRTQARFGHGRHPWRELLERGATVRIGTDSRASNPDLSVMNELRWLHGRPEGAEPELLLRLATGGARLEAGERADLAAWPVELVGTDPLTSVLESEGGPTAVVIGGRAVDLQVLRQELKGGSC
jgi:cytosine/adenosine deaminase-related metal-dependent hydrolase